MSENRKLVAILFSDVVNFSRLADEEQDFTLARLRALRSDLIRPTVETHHGRVVTSTGDGDFVEFPSVTDALRCAIEVQRAMIDRNAGVSPDRTLEFRIGIYLGEVVQEPNDDLMGTDVNIAKRLETACQAGGICLSAAAYDKIQDKAEYEFVDLGELVLKNITRPMHAY